MATTARAACHNCRRQRLKCDRSMPSCEKCTTRRQECLGHGRLLRWEMGVASRGKMAGLTYGSGKKNDQRRKLPCVRSCYSMELMASSHSNCASPHLQPILLTDPLLQDLNRTSRRYLAYCEQYIPHSSDA